MFSQPLTGFQFEWIQTLAHSTNDKETLVNLYAAVFNEFFWVEEYDFEKGTASYEEAIKISNQYHNLLNWLETQIFQITSEEGLLLPKDQGNGTVKQLESFMGKYGWENRNGWYIKVSERKAEPQR